MKKKPDHPELPVKDYFNGSAILDLLPYAMYACDRNGMVQRYNKQAAVVWGEPPVIGGTDEQFYEKYRLLRADGTYLTYHQTPLYNCLKDGLPRKNVDLLLERAAGSRILVRINVVPLTNDNGEQVGAICTCDDISNTENIFDIARLKQAEAALRESEAKYRALAMSLEKNVEEKTHDLVLRTEELKKSEERYHKMIEEVEDYAIILLDVDGTVMNWNRGAEKIKGYKEEEIVGKSFQEFYLPADREKGLPLTLLQRAKENGKATHEGWRKRKDNSAFWGSIVLTALHDDKNGNVIGFSKVTRDLTQRKLAEDRMKEYLDKLEFQNKELEQFVYAASHDLKEPLRKISLYAGFITENQLNKLDDKSLDYLQRTIQAAERMRGLIEDLLAYSRTTVHTDSYEQVDLNKVLDEVMQEHKDDSRWSNGSIRSEKLPVIQGVPFQIKQLLYNLINNSIKYKHPDRDAEIQITCETVQISDAGQQRPERADRYYRISIADNGIGFDNSHAERIFEIFQRLTNAATVRGSGIGLAICKRIVQNHNGFIEAAGKPGEGATFFIYLPR